MVKLIDSLSEKGAVGSSELAEILPLMVRVVPEIDSAAQKLEFRPTSGEHSRFEVFFYALTGDEELERFSNINPKIVLRTEDLLDNTGISGELKNKGILVFPSREYSQEVALATPKNGSKPAVLYLGDQIVIDQSIQERHITLDVAGVSQGRLPILSIPQRILIPRRLMKRQPSL